MMIPEMTPTVASSLVSSSSTAFNWGLAFLITNQFKAFQIAVTKHGTFWTFCGWCIVSLAFVVFLLPETKGRTIDEISRSFRGEKEVPRPSIDVGQHPDRSTTFVL
jgi:Sugar (and other) transporter